MLYDVVAPMASQGSARPTGGADRQKKTLEKTPGQGEEGRKEALWHDVVAPMASQGSARLTWRSQIRGEQTRENYDTQGKEGRMGAGG